MEKPVPLSKSKASDLSSLTNSHLKKTSPDKASKCDQSVKKTSKVVNSIKQDQFSCVKEPSCLSTRTDPTFPAVAITLTSPDGINKSLLRRDRNYKQSLRLKVKGIPTSKSDFWLPTVPLVPLIAQEKPDPKIVKKDNEASAIKVGAISVPAITERGHKCDILEMHEAMKLYDFQYAENKRDILHACKTLDDKWLAVSKNSILSFREGTSAFCCVSIQDVAYIWVDTNYLLLSFEMVPGSEICLIEAITGEAAKTESLISSVMFASSRHANCARNSVMVCQPELRVNEVDELPLCTKNMKDIFKGEEVVFSCIAYYETVQSHSQISNEFSAILKERMDSSTPVDIILIGKTLKIRSTNAAAVGEPFIQNKEESCTEFTEIEICLDDYVISKARDGDYHQINLRQKSTETYVQLMTTNATAFRELSWRLQFLKYSPENTPRQLVYLIVTEHSLCLFSAKKGKELLMRLLLLNLASINQPDELSCLITFDGEEMDEITSGKTVWRKISFVLASQCALFTELMKSRVDSNVI